MLYVGRIAKEKNLELAIKALKYLPNHVRFIITGPDESHIVKLLSLTERLGLRKHIRYIGSVYELSKYKLYASCKVYILASMKLLEYPF